MLEVDWRLRNKNADFIRPADPIHFQYSARSSEDSKIHFEMKMRQPKSLSRTDRINALVMEKGEVIST